MSSCGLAWIENGGFSPSPWGSSWKIRWPRHRGNDSNVVEGQAAEGRGPVTSSCISLPNFSLISPRVCRRTLRSCPSNSSITSACTDSRRESWHSHSGARSMVCIVGRPTRLCSCSINSSSCRWICNWSRSEHMDNSLFFPFSLPQVTNKTEYNGRMLLENVSLFRWNYWNIFC